MGFPDHRRIGRQLKIYATDDACGPGLPLWLPAGAAVRAEIERSIVELERRHGYSHVYTPQMAKRELYERSGHWARRYLAGLPVNRAGHRPSRHPASHGSTMSSHPSGRDRDLSIRCRRRSVREGAAAAAMA